MFATALNRDLPHGLDHLPPGPELGALLASIDVRALDGHDRVVVLRALDRMVSWYQSQRYEAIAAVAEAMDYVDPVERAEAAAAEIQPALRLTRRAAEREVFLADGLVKRVPGVRDLLADGRIDLRRARVLVHGTDHLPVDAARQAVDRIADAAPRCTTGQLGARLRRVCIEADPNDASRRYDHAVEQRRVVAEPTVDGATDLLGLDLPADRVAAAMRRINGRGLRGDGETRTIDQLRADVLLDLLDGRFVGGAGGVVDIQVDLATLAELSETPGELAGFGPVIADVARQVVEEQRRSEWRFVATDPETSLPVWTGITRRRPSAAQRRRVQLRDRTCVFPGCRMPAVQSDLDHRTPYAEGGPTTESNLGPLCRHHHRIKTDHGWTYAPLANGDFVWTSRLGHAYTASGLPP